MARPVYETDADRGRQQEVIAVVEQRLRCTAIGMRRLYDVDYALRRGSEVRAWAEVKVRTHAFGTHPTYILSLHKFMNGCRLEHMTGCPFLLVVGFTDCVAFCEPEKIESPDVRIGGRTDRGDSDDVEPVVHIPMKAFRRIS